MSKKNKEKKETNPDVVVSKPEILIPETFNTIEPDKTIEEKTEQVPETSNTIEPDKIIEEKTEQVPETFNTIEPDKTIEEPTVVVIDNDSCENFLRDVFNQYENVIYVMAKTIDGISFNIIALDRDKVPAKNSNGYILLSSLEMHETVSNIFTKVSNTRNELKKNIVIVVNRSIKVSIFVNGIEDFLISGKNLNEY